MLGKRVGYRNAYTMKAARKRIGAASIGLGKLAAGMEPRKNNLQHRRVLFWMHAGRNTSAIILHRH